MPDIEELFERLCKVEAIASDFREWRAGVMVEHVMLKEGVANFKVFKERGTKFFDYFEAKAEADEKRRSRNLSIAGIAALILVPLFAWGGATLIHAGITIYRIEQDWQRAHPSEFQQKSLYDSQPQVYAVDKQQDAGGLPPVHY